MDAVGGNTHLISWYPLFLCGKLTEQNFWSKPVTLQFYSVGWKGDQTLEREWLGASDLASVALLVMDQCHQFPQQQAAHLSLCFRIPDKLVEWACFVLFCFPLIDLCFKPYTLKVLLISVLFVCNRPCRHVVSGLLRASLCVAGSFSSSLGSRVRNDELPNILLRGINLLWFRKAIKKKTHLWRHICIAWYNILQMYEYKITLAFWVSSLPV